MIEVTIIGTKNATDNGRTEEGPERGIITAESINTKIPRKYKVLLLNDDFTPMDFVVEVLQKFFTKSPAEAQQIMLKVHYEGRGLCGIYTLEVAETKCIKVNQYAKEHQHPLQCTLEAE